RAAETRNRPGGGSHQRAVLRRRVDADPLPGALPSPRRAGPAVPAGRRRLGDTAARRHESRRQGVRGGAARQRRRAAPVGDGRRSVLSRGERSQRGLTRWLAERQAVALFLDYDGTLTPLVDDPATAALSEDARQLLRQASATPRLDVTIVSGRALADLSGLVNVPGLTYVGNHGFEIEGPGVSFRHEKLDRFRRALDEAATDLRALAVPGARVEHKGCTLSFHLRGVERGVAEEARDRASSILRRRHLRASLGNEVGEGRPTG